MRLKTVGTLLALSLASFGCSATPTDRDEPSGRATVVLLHGLARSAYSMHDMELALGEAGYRVCNIAYPTREHSVSALASRFVAHSIAQCVPDASEPVNVVTHSLGGIVVRELARSGLVGTFGRVVMLGSPNRGSEVVDVLGDGYLFNAINGPAGAELGTSPDSTPNRLGPATFQVGVIAGDRSINWINSLMIPGPDDGKVSVKNAKLDGMKDFIVVHAAHPFLMTNDEVIRQTLRFLDSGCFEHEDAKDTGAVGRCVPAADKS